MTVVIRPAVEADAPRIVEMSHAIRAHEGGPPSTLTLEAVLRHGFGPSALFTCYVAELDRQLVGHIGLTTGFEFGDGCVLVWVADLFVEAPCRRRGIARKLIARAARHAIDRDAGFLHWSMVPANSEARAFYAAIGATEDKARHLYLDETAMQALADRTDCH